MTTLRLRDSNTIPRESVYYEVLEEKRLRLEAALRRRKEDLLREQSGEVGLAGSAGIVSIPASSRSDSNSSLFKRSNSNPNMGPLLVRRTNSNPKLLQRRISEQSMDVGAYGVPDTGVMDSPTRTPPAIAPSPPLWPEFLDKLKELQGEYQKELDTLYLRYEQRWYDEKKLKVNKTTAMPALPDSEYLARAIGSALTQALAEVCDRRPWDPIDYLSNWLRKYADNSRYKREESVNQLKLELELEEQKIEDVRRAAILLERQQIQDEEQRRREQYLKVQACITDPNDSLQVAPSSENKPKKPDAKVKEIVYKEVTILLPTEVEHSRDETDSNPDERESSPVNTESNNGLYTIAEGEGEFENNKLEITSDKES